MNTENFIAIEKYTIRNNYLQVCQKNQHMDLDKLSYCENIWKLSSNVEKCKVLHFGSKNI